MNPSEQDTGRTFICIPMPAPVRDALSALNRRMASLAEGCSCPRPEHAHLTLVFLGALAGPQQAAAVRAGMDGAAAGIGPFRIRLARAGTFGPRGSPRVVWAGVGRSDPLAALQARLADAARGAGIALENRPFRPHLTIARIRKPLPPGSLTSIISCINNTHFAEIMVDRVLLMNSLLNGPGPRFTEIHQARL